MIDNQEKRKYILSGISGFLKDKGFKKKAYTFSRETEIGLLQIIDFSLGPSWSTESGCLLIEFGIYTDEWNKYLRGYDKQATIRTYDCEIRDCYCTIINQNDYNFKFDLFDNLDNHILYIINCLDKILLSYFEMYKSRTDILNGYEILGKTLGLPPRHKLSIGIITLTHGNTNTGLKIIEEEYKANMKNSFYEKVYNNVIKDYGKTNA
jgi:hypothetical protein